MTNTLTRFESDKTELAIDTATGEIFLITRGYAKLSGKSATTVINRCKGAFKFFLNDGCCLVPVKSGPRVQNYNIIPLETALKWLDRDKPELASEMRAIGPVKYLAGLVGYVHKPFNPEPAPPSAITKTHHLERFDRDGAELVIDTRTGEAFATQSGYARMSGKDRSTIVKRCQGSNKVRIKSAEVHTPGGLQGCELIPADLVFKWLLKDNIELAEEMGAAGATVYIHQLAGFKISSTATQKQPAPTPPPVTPMLLGDIRLHNMIASLDRLDVQLLDPRFKQGLQDLALDMLGVRQPALTPENIASREGVWCGVVERAEHLGYAVELVLQHRSKLGRYIAKQIGGAVKENRLCNGTYRPINLYRISVELDAAIADYFSNL